MSRQISKVMKQQLKRDRVNSGIEMLTERVRCLEENVAFDKAATCQATYVQQIELLTGDFYREREEREKLASKVGTLQWLLQHLREKYQTLHHEVLAIQNGCDGDKR